MPRSPMDHVAFSCEPDTCLAYLLGGFQAIVCFDMDEGMQKYTGRLLLHTTGYDEESVKNLANLGYSPDDMPAYSIQGWVEVKEIKRYDPITFAIDHKLHHQGTDLGALLRETENIGADCYGIIVHKPLALQEPIYDVLRDEHEIMPGDFWSPQAPMELQAFKMALDRGRAQLAVKTEA